MSKKGKIVGLFILGLFVVACKSIVEPPDSCLDSSHFVAGNPNIVSGGLGNVEYAWSPDGQKLIFRLEGEIGLIDLVSGKTQQASVLMAHEAFGMAWSPNSQNIVFASRERNHIAIYVVDTVTWGVIRLTEGEWDGNPAWSPDSQKIAFHRNGDLYIMLADGSEIHRLTNVEQPQQFEWSPDSQQIVFVSAAAPDDVFVINADGSKLRQLTDSFACDRQPSWSPDGQKIAFISSENDQVDLFVMNSDGSNRSNLTNNENNELDFKWFPDGDRLAIIYFANMPPMGIRQEIFFVNSDGTNLHQFTQKRTLDESLMFWSPDGLWLSYLFTTREYEMGTIREWGIEIVNINTSDVVYHFLLER